MARILCCCGCGIGQQLSFDLTPSLETSICHRLGSKGTQKKRGGCDRLRHNLQDPQQQRALSSGVENMTLVVIKTKNRSPGQEDDKTVGRDSGGLDQRGNYRDI